MKYIDMEGNEIKDECGRTNAVIALLEIGCALWGFILIGALVVALYVLLT